MAISQTLDAAPTASNPDRRTFLDRTWGGHPRGAYLVAFTELWERFSYWGLAGLLVLYLTAAPEQGGWGWANADAVKLYGWYGGLAFALPAIGAWLANNYLGERRCILWGAVGIAIGHFLLASPVLFPWAWQQLVPGDAGPEALARAREAGHGAFLGGLLLIVSGTGLMKPTISSIVAQLYPAGGARRDEAFAYFFVAIYIGALFGALVTGYLGERAGWHYGLGAAGVGMLIGLVLYVALQNRWLGDLGREPIKQVVASREPLTREERHRIGVVLVQGLFTILYALGFYQMYGLLSLYAHNELDRYVGSFLVPTTWVQTISLCSFFVCVPATALLWRRMAKRNRNPSASYKLAMGLGVMAVGYVILIFAEAARDGGKPSFMWLGSTYLLFGLGDSLVWANQVSLTSKLAPARYSAFFIGAWYLCIGIGTWLTGPVGAWAQGYPYSTSFTWLALGCAIAALTIAALTPLLRRYMHGAEHLELS